MTWVIRVNGRSLMYSSLRIRRSIETTAGEAQALLINPVEKGSPVEVFEVVRTVGTRSSRTIEVPRLTGVVESSTGSITRGYTATIRSSTCALMVWQSGRNQLFRRNAGETTRTHADIAASLAGQVGLTVATGAPTRTISRFRVKSGDTLQAALQRLAAAGTWVLTDNELGQVKMYDYSGATPSATWSPTGRPLLEVESIDNSIVEWRDAVLVRGQRIAVAADEDASDGQVSDDFQATTVPSRPSQLVIPNSAANSKSEAVALALWEITKRTGQGFGESVSLANWSASPGDLVHLRDRANNLDTDRIVQSVEANITAQSETYGARLVSPLVYDSRPRRAVLPGVA